MLLTRLLAAALLIRFPVAAAETVEIKGRITNPFAEDKYRAVQVIVTDRLGVELGRTHPNGGGQYELKVNAPQFIILKAILEGYPQALYQLDTREYKDSTSDREENRVFGELRIPTYHQNITFGGQARPATLEDLLAGENPVAVKAFREAQAHKQAGDLSKAIGVLNKLLRTHPSFYLGYIELGMILAGQQENDRALEVFTRAQQLRPEHAWAPLGLGMALNNKKDYTAAAPHLEKAVARDPDSIHAQFQLGQAAFYLGDHERALVCFRRVIELEPKFAPLAYKTLAAIYVKKQDAQQAAQALESYLLQFPDAPDAEKVKQILEKLKR
jgi:tetratricopeptide (TPR) repeat protein